MSKWTKGKGWAVVMRFSFSSEVFAVALRNKIRALGLPAVIDQSGDTFFVVTDSRVLDHAAELKQFLHGGAR